MPSSPVSAPSSRQLYLRLIRHFRPYLGALLATMVGVGLAAATDVMLVAQLQNVVDALRPASELSQQGGQLAATIRGWISQLGISDPLQSALWAIPAIILGLAIVRMLASFAGDYGSAWLNNRVQADLREQMFTRILQLPNHYFDHHATGTILSRVTFDANQVAQAGLNVINVAVRDSIATVGYLATLLIIDWQLALFCLVLLPLVGLIVTVAGKRIRRLSEHSQQAMGELSRVLDESISGQRVVKIFGGQQYEQARFDAVTKRNRQLSVKQAATGAINSALIMMLIGATLAAVIYVALLRARSGAITPGAFVAFMGALMAMQGPIKNLTKINEPLQRGLAAAASVFSLLDERIEPDQGTRAPDRLTGRIRFEDVVFHYAPEQTDAPPALRGVSLDIAPGETVALVGGSGSGKSTMASLLPRFYEPTAGRILLDEQDLRDYPLAKLRRHIALVSQDVVLFNDTLAANIAYGDAVPDRERIVAAARAAYAHDFISALPEGYDTQIGENGARLSGGQRQRLAIARALYKDAPILILDEATSALDSESERQVQAALDVLMQGRTTLVIAHRLSTIERASRIVAMQSGRIAEIGTHAELLARDGLYAGLHRQQGSAG